MTRYQPGEIVDVNIKGATVVKDDGYRLEVAYFVGTEQCVTGTVSLVSDGLGVFVNQVAPPEWPPQPGDLWADGDDREWFARCHVCADVGCRSKVELVDDRGTSHHHLSPVPVGLAPLTLIRRKSPAVTS